MCVLLELYYDVSDSQSYTYTKIRERGNSTEKRLKNSSGKNM